MAENKVYEYKHLVLVVDNKGRCVQVQDDDDERRSEQRRRQLLLRRAPLVMMLTWRIILPRIPLSSLSRLPHLQNLRTQITNSV
jgi:hypothetical protein